MPDARIFHGDIVSNAPSRNPAGNDTLTGVLNFALLKFLQNVDACLPAEVIAYDPATNRAQVQPQIVQVTTGGEQVPRAQVASVPVARWGAGGILLYFPVQTGDKGWLIANDRDISIYKQTGEQSAPNTNRLHTFEDGWFLPDSALDAITLAAEDAGNAVLQNFAGTVRLALWPGLFKFTCPQVGIGDTEGYTPNANAVLDVQSTTKAFMFPRMTQAQRDAISPPSEGMAVWNTTNHTLSTYNGSAWS